VANIDLEVFREIFKDNRTHIAIGRISEVEMAKDRSVVRVKVVIFPENVEIIARMSWEQVGPGSGIFGFPVVNDLVLVAFADGDIDQAFVIKRLTSKEDKVPLQAVSGHSVMKALDGKKVFITSDTKICLSKGDAEPTQPIVLGNVLKEALSSLIEEIIGHTHIGNLGYPTGTPIQAGAFSSIKSSPVDDSAMLSDIAFTEKG